MAAGFHNRNINQIDDAIFILYNIKSERVPLMRYFVCEYGSEC